jgi:hypothetical protein
VSKDRARPFSKKHRKYWIPVTGGMIFIGIMNVAIGFCSYDKPSDTHDRIHVVIPPAAYRERPITVPTLGEPAGTQVSLTPDANPVDGQ